MSAPPRGHGNRDGNAMTGYSQSVALDGDATNQARTKFGFDGNALTAPAPKPKKEPKAPAPEVKSSRPLPAPKPKPKPEQELQAKPAPKPRPKWPTPFRAPRPPR